MTVNPATVAVCVTAAPPLEGRCFCIGVAACLLVLTLGIGCGGPTTTGNPGDNNGGDPITPGEIGALPVDEAGEAAPWGRPSPLGITQGSATDALEGLPPVAVEAGPIIVHAGVPADRIADWAADTRAFLAVLRERFPPTAIPPPCRVAVFADRGAFRVYARAHAPENEGALGYLDPPYRLIVTFDQIGRQAMRRTFFHELTHLALRDHLGHAFPPTWLDEGLACHFETAIVRPGGEVEVGAPYKRYRAEIERLLTQGRAPAWKTLCTMPYGEFATPDHHALEAHYAFAWGIVHYLLTADGGTNASLVTEMLGLIRGRPDPSTRHTEVFELVLAPRLPGLERAMHGWYLLGQ